MYVVVLVGVVVTTAAVAELSPAEGDQVYVAPPEAVNVIWVPAQMITSKPALIGAFANTVTVTGSVPVHPAAEVPVTVYVVVTPGVKVTLAPVAALK